MNPKQQTERLTALIQPRYPSGRVVILDDGEFAIQAGILSPQWQGWEALKQYLIVGRNYAVAKSAIKALLNKD